MTDSLVIGGELQLMGPVGFHDWDGEGFTVRDVTEALAELDGDITVRINSGGGFAFDGIAIHSLLRQHDGEVTTVVQGIAASAASAIFMAGENRIMAEGALLMIHDATGFTVGTEADHIKTAETLNKLSNSLAGIYAGRTGRELKVERAVMREETWLNGAESMEAGYGTAEIATGASPASAFDYRQYKNAPDFLVKEPEDVYEDFNKQAAALIAVPRPQVKEDDMVKAPAASPGEVKYVSKPLTLSILKADHPDIATELADEVIDAVAAEGDHIGPDAAKAERERIKECLAVLGAGDAGDTVKALCFDGKSQAGDVALAVLAEARAKGSDHLASLAEQEAKLTALKTAPSADVPDAPTEASTPDGWKAEYEASKNLRDEFLCAADYAAYKKADKAGRVQILHTKERKA